VRIKSVLTMNQRKIWDDKPCRHSKQLTVDGDLMFESATSCNSRSKVMV